MALTILDDYLRRLGLSDLSTWAKNALINGASEAEIMVDIENQPAFKQRFWMIEARRKAGLPEFSPAQVLDYEATASEMAKAFGITITQQQVGELIANDVSVAELEDRVGIAASAVFQVPPEVRSELQRFYGIGTGDLTEYWLDPKKKAPELQRRFAAAQIAGEAQRTGFDEQLSAAQAESLFEAGMDVQSARQAFGQLVQADELFEAVDVTEQDIGLEGQLRLITGDTDVAQEVQRRGERRAARFQEGGGFATGEEGLAGLGSANQ